MNYTNKQLKQALAKMLPAKVYMNTNGGQMYHRLDGEPQPKVLDGELLHLCWLVECALPHDKTNEYIMAISESIGSIFHMDVVRATWQQRTVALAKTLGIKII